MTKSSQSSALKVHVHSSANSNSSRSKLATVLLLTASTSLVFLVDGLIHEVCLGKPAKSGYNPYMLEICAIIICVIFPALILRREDWSKQVWITLPSYWRLPRHDNDIVKVVPAVAQWNQAISNAAKAGDLDKAKALLQEMQQLNVKPDIVSYNAIVHACARCGDPECAEAWVKKMQAAGIQPKHCNLQHSNGCLQQG